MGNRRLVWGATAAFALAPAVTHAEPGNIVPVEIGSNGNNLGYWEYLPPDYTEDEDFTLLVYLSGICSVGTGVDDSPCPVPNYACDQSAASGLCNNLRAGIHTVIYESIQDGNPAAWPTDERPFVVISPQNPIPQEAYDVDELDTFFEYLVGAYSLDPRRLYLFGNSQGGRSVLLYMHDYPERFAASAIMPGGAGMELTTDACLMNRNAFWAFHGELDNVASFELSAMELFVTAWNDCDAPRPTARLTVYTGGDHNAWEPTYRPNLGMTWETDPLWDPYDINVYDWLLEHDKPEVTAPADLMTTTDSATLDLPATIVDDDPITWLWEQTAGTPVTFDVSDEATGVISGFDVGVYTFSVLAVDADGQWDQDEVNVTVEMGVGGGGGTTTGGATTTGGGADTSGAGSTGSGGQQGTGSSGGVGTGSSGGPVDTNPGTGSGDGDPSTTTGGSASASGPVSATAPATTVAPTSGGSEGSGSDGDEAGSNTSDGCACRGTTAPDGAWFLAVLLLARRRRRG